MYRNLTNSDIVPFALRGESGRTKTGNMSTDAYRVGFIRYGAPYVGHLPKPWRDILDDAFREGQVSQVIYSYSTPIAWYDTRYGWIVPLVSYSVTTSGKHQTHLWRLRGRHIFLPDDASPEEVQRVLDRKMIFTTRPGVARGEMVTIPGPNYVEGE